LPIIITFDDSLKNTFDVAYPKMKEYGYKGVVFAITSMLGGVWPDPPYKDKPQMTWDELRILHKDGWEIQSHSHTHPYFTQIDRDTAIYELTVSKRLIADNIGKAPTAFAYPFCPVAYEDLVAQYYRTGRTCYEALWDGRPSAFVPAVVVDTETYQNTDFWLRFAKYSYVVFYMHTITDNPDFFELSPDQFDYFLSRVYQSRVKVTTFDQKRSLALPLSLLGAGTASIAYAIIRSGF